MNNDYLELEKKYNELKEATSRLPCTSKLLGNLADEFDTMHKMVSSRYVAERIYTLLDELDWLARIPERIYTLLDKLDWRLGEGDEDDFDPLKEWNASQERIAIREQLDKCYEPEVKLSETPPGTGFDNPHWWDKVKKNNPDLW